MVRDAELCVLCCTGVFHLVCLILWVCSLLWEWYGVLNLWEGGFWESCFVVANNMFDFAMLLLEVHVVCVCSSCHFVICRPDMLNLREVCVCMLCSSV